MVIPKFYLELFSFCWELSSSITLINRSEITSETSSGVMFESISLSVDLEYGRYLCNICSFEFLSPRKSGPLFQFELSLFMIVVVFEEMVI